MSCKHSISIFTILLKKLVCASACTHQLSVKYGVQCVKCVEKSYKRYVGKGKGSFISFKFVSDTPPLYFPPLTKNLSTSKYSNFDNKELDFLYLDKFLFAGWRKSRVWCVWHQLKRDKVTFRSNTEIVVLVQYFL